MKVNPDLLIDGAFRLRCALLLSCVLHLRRIASIETQSLITLAS